MFNEEEFQKALRQPRLGQPVPKTINTRAVPLNVIDEPTLMDQTQQWFADYEKKIAFYAEHGFDIAWTLEWAKKYWWSWLVRDMSYNHELYTADLRYKDVTTMGDTIVGLDDFVAYNFAFFDAIPDWRYDPIPGQAYIDIDPSGEVRIAIRYYGSGHIVGPLKLHPYDQNAVSIPGTGAFVQCTAVDRYHFNADGLMHEGETLYDFLDAAQTPGILPGANTLAFRNLMKAASLATNIGNKLGKGKATRLDPRSLKP